MPHSAHWARTESSQQRRRQGENVVVQSLRPVHLRQCLHKLPRRCPGLRHRSDALLARRRSGGRRIRRPRRSTHGARWRSRCVALKPRQRCACCGREVQCVLECAHASEKGGEVPDLLPLLAQDRGQGYGGRHVRTASLAAAHAQSTGACHSPQHGHGVQRDGRECGQVTIPLARVQPACVLRQHGQHGAHEQVVCARLPSGAAGQQRGAR